MNPTTLTFDQISVLKSAVFNRMSESATYRTWKPEYAVLNVTEFIDEQRKVKAIDPNVLTLPEMKQLGFGNWDDDMYLVPLWMHPFLKAGIKLHCINDRDYEVTYDEKGNSSIDDDTRGGMLAYGVRTKTAESADNPGPG